MYESADLVGTVIQEPTDAIVRITSTNICGSDLHLYEVLGRYLQPGDILGHEAMGIVEEVGLEASSHIAPGDRVVIPCGIACGHCWMYRHNLYAQRETTQNRNHGKGASNSAAPSCTARSRRAG